MQYEKKKVLIALIIISICFSTGCSSQEANVNSDIIEEQPITVEVAKAAEGQIESMVSYSGRVKPAQEIMVTPKQPGKVSKINFDLGQRVKAAMVSAEINYNDAKINYETIKTLYEAGAESKFNYDRAQSRFKLAKQQYETAKANYNLPEGYSIKFTGEDQQMVEAFSSLKLALILSVFLVYMVMAIQFESLVHPLTIMFSVPVAYSGSIIGLAITNNPLSVPAYVGVIMLAGIVVNNAIVLVDYINTLRERGLDKEAAIIKAGPTRLRPILMTTLTTILAMIPLALGLGEGAEAMAPMAIVVIFGLTTSTLLTLLIVPVIYCLLDDLSISIKHVRKKSKKQPGVNTN